jgi:hypothetical protein
VNTDVEHIYWTNFGSPVGGGTTIGRANLDGTSADQSFITGATSPGAVEVDDEHIYWTNFGATTISRAKLDGTSVEEGFITGASTPAGLAVTNSHIYWVNSGTYTIGRESRWNWRRAGLHRGGERRPRAGRRWLTPQRKGTARLTVVAPGPGTLSLAETKKLKGDEKRLEASGTVRLSIEPKRQARKRLRERGKAVVKAEVTYTPAGGDPNIVANTDTKTLTLVKRG